jgi:hypothetical protein
MTRTTIDASTSAALALAVLLSCLGLAACGGSSAGTTKTSATATNPTGGAGAGGAGVSRLGALRECLQKHGITLPEGSAAAGHLPKGVTRAQLQAALKKCSGSLGQGLLNSGAAQLQALRNFAACMRSNGVNLSAPNTSGNGPLFDTRGLNTGTAQFRAARNKCAHILSGVFGLGRPGGAGSAKPGA